ncbi:M56 family metallopeptidase [Faecalicatena sp. Marseille-Q4148]|nr:M56 family metallopeptidase [Faecalicatena sp. Marseille-Q4148]
MIISGINISTYSFISAMIIFSLSVIIVLIFAKKTSFIAAYGIHFILFSIVLSIIRLLIPLDIYWAKIIDLDYILHPLEKILLFFHTDLEEMKPVFLILWGSGSLLFFLYVSWTFVMDIYTLKKLKKIKPEKTLSFIEESEFDKIDIVISPQISVPKVWGICKPHIYLPDLELDESEWRLIINHEIQHIRNHDTLIKMIILVITMIFWWNPIMLLLWKKMDHFLEMRCDTMLLKSASKNEKVSYLNMIIKVLRQTNDHRGELVSIVVFYNLTAALFAGRR